MKRVFWLLLGLCTTAACAVHYTPAVTPQKIPPVSPRIRARALLLITPSFESYLSREKSGVQRVFHYGEAGAKALSALVTESFTVVEIKRIAAAAGRGWPGPGAHLLGARHQPCARRRAARLERFSGGSPVGVGARSVN